MPIVSSLHPSLPEPWAGPRFRPQKSLRDLCRRGPAQTRLGARPKILGGAGSQALAGRPPGPAVNTVGGRGGASWESCGTSCHRETRPRDASAGTAEETEKQRAMSALPNLLPSVKKPLFPGSCGSPPWLIAGLRIVMLSGKSWSTVFGIGFLLCGCGQPSITEKIRVPNASKTLDAVCTENYGDATVAAPSGVYVVQHGQPVSGKPVFIGDYVSDLAVAWVADDDLKITAKSARVYKELLPKGSVDLGGSTDKRRRLKVELDVKDLKIR